MVVCDPRHLSFVVWWIQDPSFLCLGLLVQIPLSVLITWQHNWRRCFQFRVDQQLEFVCLVQAFFDDEYVIDPYMVEFHSKTKSSIKGHMFGPHLVKVRCVTKSSNKGHMFGPYLVRVCSETKSSNDGAHFGPHLVKVHYVTKSSDKGHNSGHIWSKSAAWQSPPMRGKIWATFGQSPLRDKVLRWGAKFGPHLVEVRCVTKSSNEGYSFDHIGSKSAVRQSPPTRGIIFLPHLAIVHCVTTSADGRSWVLFSGQIWPKSAVWHVLRQIKCVFLFMIDLANASWLVWNSH